MQATEIWKPIRGYEGLYEVSNLGRVKSCGRLRTYPDRRQVWCNELLKLQYTHDGYLQAHLYRKGNRKVHKVNRLVALAFLPNPDNLPHVHHKNHIRDDNRVENLKWVTASENQKEAYKNGKLIPPSQRKYTMQQVREIRELSDQGVSDVEISKKYGMALSTVTRITRHITYREKDSPEPVSNRRRKLTCQDVRDIRKEYSQGQISQLELGKQFGVSERAVSNIVKHNTYKDC